MQHDAHDYLRGAHDFGNLAIVVAFVVTQHKHLRGSRPQTLYRLPDQLLQFAIGVLGLRVLCVTFHWLRIQII